MGVKCMSISVPGMWLLKQWGWAGQIRTLFKFSSVCEFPYYFYCYWVKVIRFFFLMWVFTSECIPALYRYWQAFSHLFSLVNMFINVSWWIFLNNNNKAKGVFRCWKKLSSISRWQDKKLRVRLWSWSRGLAGGDSRGASVIPKSAPERQEGTVSSCVSSL